MAQGEPDRVQGSRAGAPATAACPACQSLALGTRAFLRCGRCRGQVRRRIFRCTRCGRQFTVEPNGAGPVGAGQ